MNVVLRPATAFDAERVAEIYLASRKQSLPFAPLAHSDEEVKEWIANILIPEAAVTVALLNNEIVGMMALSRAESVGWIDQLYLAPAFVGQGIGSQFVERAKATLGAPIRLYTFQENIPTRRFYERHGFQAIAFSNGQANEEKCPDVLYEWVG